ncbi:MAG TPA: hypothetical protein GX404_02170 [Syntrophomonadaceae bacterium]|nr:hypothetical protein [Syntrophomonadaceae bacterium]
MSQLKIAWTKNTIAPSESQKKISARPGLEKLNHSVILKDSPFLWVRWQRSSTCLCLKNLKIKEVLQWN